MACAYSLLQKGLVGELVLADVMKDKLKGEVMDLQHGGAYQHGRIVECDDDYEASRNSDICIIAAGVRQQDGETRLQLADRNRDVLKHIIPPLVAKSPNTVILMVSNPVDIMTYIAWQLSGLPANRVLGSGTFLDSSRFRTLIGQELDVNASSVHAWIVGEHGDSSVPVWSSVNIAGVHLDTSHSANFDKIHERVVSAAYDVIKLKQKGYLCPYQSRFLPHRQGYTNWAIGSAVSTLCGIILQNQQRVVPVSTYVKGVHGIDESVFLSLPCVLGSRGVERILHQPLDDKELQSLQSSAKNLWAVQKDIKF
ncbi:uncharacterized protein MONBRDRAFT_32392 [Monosiga brevicollis MX1]|uniref:L-lactate dehydrogenase n=1 Tax=Monosiga brevicollis TaxID=81824 RepID=A9UZ89_MONBE|nr:uncharacterized protein MONBRDRAFT_32392 [Monosiga brevicollis MX1]EDQ89323.1 predicted protein [Monosiga brevicollis MX1]|eukprot:XP_001745899.1 hypothetical protein [Monosiga brevicollis MX1]